MALQNNERRTALILMVITVIVIVSIAVGVTAGFLLRSSPSSSGSEMDDQASDDGSGIISRNSTALSPLDECILRTTQPDELLRFRNAVLDLSPSMSASDIAGLSDVIDNALAGIAGRSALCWMIEEDRYDYITLEDDNVVQRFAMAATYFHFVVSHFKGTTGPASEDEGMIASSRLLSEYNWLSGVHVCDWDFVSCNGVPNNKVTDLFLDSLDLDRRIPSELALLTDLQYLKLTQNKLTGTIPSELTRLKQLEVLSLEHNALTGKIPSGLEKMTRLQDIKLAWNQLTGEIPSQMFTIPFLSWIDLSMNQLEGTLPEDLASGTGVLGFFVDSNRITGMIPDMSSWSNLEVLSLGDNPIDGSFPNLTLCSNLEYLQLSSTEIHETIPSSLWSLRKLKFVDLSNTPVSGTLPTELVQLTALEFLSLNDSRLGGSIPSSYGSLVQLKQLNLSMDGVTGTVPTELGLLTNLDALEFGDNINGIVPSTICDLRTKYSLMFLKAPCSRCKCCDNMCLR